MSTPRLTALRRAGPGRVALEVDGVRWRVVSDDVVVRAGLAAGQNLDRATLRRVGRELRRADALARAGRTLARRDVSEASLRARLGRAGVAAATVEETTDVLRRTGTLDDERFATRRAEALAERGWGNAAVEARLETEGAPPEAISEAVAGLEPEWDRARRASGKLPPRKAAALLARRGFDPDTIEAVVPGLDEGR